jgi:hypothetical protein
VNRYRPLLCSAISALLALLALLAWASAGAQLPGADSDQAPSPDAAPLPGAVPPASSAPPATGLSRWLNPATAPFLPIPEIAVDPNSGTTVGFIPTWLQTNDHGEISRIIAPDVLHNPYFGWGAHGRVYAYPSADEQWSVVADLKQRVERGIDVEYQDGRSRLQPLSVSASLVYDRNGSPRFYGIGNESPAIDETNYTEEQELAEAQIGWNISQALQLRYTGRARTVDVYPGTLTGIESIQRRFARALGEGSHSEQLNRLGLVYDTRDDLTVPTRGAEWVAYSGMSSRHGLFNDSLYSEAGVDGREFWPINSDTVLAAHMALRYLPSAHRVPFWALSSLGGGQSVIGGEQPLRGYGEGRYYDRDSFDSTLELRRRVLSFDASSTRVDLELAPFIDAGRVFARADTMPLSQLHTVGGLGFRGVARPFVVGYVDMGYGSEGLAVFTGINYPF